MNKWNSYYQKPFVKGLLLGFGLYVWNAFVMPLISNENLSQRKILIGLPLWLLCGVAIIYFNRYFFGSRK